MKNIVNEYKEICSGKKLRIIYILTRFPSVSETFIVNQIVEMISRGHEVMIYAFAQGNSDVLHDKIRRYELLNKTLFMPELPSSLSTLCPVKS